jgi:hypothetical protein
MVLEDAMALTPETVLAVADEATVTPETEMAEAEVTP